MREGVFFLFYYFSENRGPYCAAFILFALSREAYNNYTNKRHERGERTRYEYKSETVNC